MALLHVLPLLPVFSTRRPERKYTGSSGVLTPSCPCCPPGCRRAGLSAGAWGRAYPAAKGPEGAGGGAGGASVGQVEAGGRSNERYGDKALREC
jgi:hypothetical protein